MCKYQVSPTKHNWLATINYQHDNFETYFGSIQIGKHEVYSNDIWRVVQCHDCD